jgi:hypothetical protein
MQLQSALTFTLPIIDKGCYNQSHQNQLTLYTKQLGDILLPYENWDLSLTNFLKLDIYKVELKTCQGTLTLTPDIITREIKKEIIEGQEIQFTCPGVWQGSCGGLLIGYSGYGEYTFDEKNAYVSKSVFNLISDFRENLEFQWLYPSAIEGIWQIWYATTYCSYKDYQLRVEVMEQKYGYYAVRTMAKEVREILSAFEELRSENSNVTDNDCGLNLKPVIEWGEKVEDAVKEYQLATANIPH